METANRLVATADFADGACRVEGYINLAQGAEADERMVRAISLLVIDNQGPGTCTVTLVTTGTDDVLEVSTAGPGERREFTFPPERYERPAAIDHRNVDYRITYG